MAGQGAGESGTGGSSRRATRTGVLKRAQIVFGSSVVDCVVVDTSTNGLRARTASVVAVPERVSLRFADGSVCRARRRWARGTELGFELEAGSGELLEAMIAGLTREQRRALIAMIEASLDQA